MALKLTITNVLQLFSLIAPLLLVFFLVMASIFNQNVKGLIYLAGILIASIINLFLMNLFGSSISESGNIEKTPLVCNIIEIPYLSNYNSPSQSALLIGFTLAYLVLPMTYNGQINYMILISLLCLLGLDMVTKVFKHCTTWPGALLGAVSGIVLGIAWYSMFHMSGYDSLLYFDEVSSNNVICSKPSKQTFKCSVYRNGELISSNIA